MNSLPCIPKLTMLASCSFSHFRPGSRAMSMAEHLSKCRTVFSNRSHACQLSLALGSPTNHFISTSSLQLNHCCIRNDILVSSIKRFNKQGQCRSTRSTLFDNCSYTKQPGMSISSMSFSDIYHGYNCTGVYKANSNLNNVPSMKNYSDTHYKYDCLHFKVPGSTFSASRQHSMTNVRINNLPVKMPSLSQLGSRNHTQNLFEMDAPILHISHYSSAAQNGYCGVSHCTPWSHIQTRYYTNDDQHSQVRIQKAKAKVQEVKDSLGDKVKELKDNMYTIPNLLTVSRMFASPILGYLVLQESYQLACGVFIYAGITDILDGWIARNIPNQTSFMGSFLDPLADKLLASILFVTLTMVNLVPVPLTVLVLSRDVCLITAAFYIRYISLPDGERNVTSYFNVTKASAQLKPRLISKINTAVQLSLVSFTLAAPIFDYIDHPALQALWYLTAATTIISGVDYVLAKDTFKILKQSKHNKDN